jgi:hypothetical protein
MYGLYDDSADIESIICALYNTLIPNNEGSDQNLSFYNMRIRIVIGAIT